MIVMPQSIATGAGSLKPDLGDPSEIAPGDLVRVFYRTASATRNRGSRFSSGANGSVTGVRRRALS